MHAWQQRVARYWACCSKWRPARPHVSNEFLATWNRQHVLHAEPVQYRPLLHDHPQLFEKLPCPVYPELAGLLVHAVHEPALVPLHPLLY